jgi:hypothetical protein
MPTAQITTFQPTHSSADFIALAIDGSRETDLDVYAASDHRSATLYIRSAHEAREIAQHLEGAKDALVAWAEAQERKPVTA